MAAFTTAAIVGAAVVGAAATAYSVNKQKQAAKEQARRVAQQQQQAKLESRNRAVLDAARDESGADIMLGRGVGAAPAATDGAGQGAATSRTGSVGARVGGIGNQRAAGGMGQAGRASRRVGL